MPRRKQRLTFCAWLSGAPNLFGRQNGEARPRLTSAGEAHTKKQSKNERTLDLKRYEVNVVLELCT